MKNYYQLHFQFLVFAICTYFIFYTLVQFPYVIDMFSVEYGLNSYQDMRGLLKPFYQFIVNKPLLLKILFLSRILWSIGLLFNLTRKASLVLLIIFHYFFENLSVVGSHEVKFINFMFLLLLAIPYKKLNIFKSYKQTYWMYPREIQFCAYLVAGVSYSVSGYYKWLTPAWQNGSFLYTTLKQSTYSRLEWGHLLDSNTIQILLSFLNYLVVSVEVLFLPMVFHPLGRFLGFTILTGMHLGILLTLNLSQMTLGMLTFHIFLFDPRWLRLGKKRRF